MPDTLNHLDLAIIRQPAMVSLDAKLLEAMAQMMGTTDLANISVTNGSATHEQSGSSYLVIVDDEQVVGLLTERDVVRFTVQQLPLAQLTLREVWGRTCSQAPITVKESALTNVEVVLTLFEQHQLSHLPILDETARLAGVISRKSLQQMLSAAFRQEIPSANQEIPSAKAMPIESARRCEPKAPFCDTSKAYASLLDVLPVGIIHTDLEGVCTYVSERHGEILGVNAKTLVGRRWEELFSPELAAQFLTAYERARFDNGPMTVTGQVTRSDKSQVWIYGQWAIEYDAAGQEIGFVGTATDITDQQAALRERERAESLLENQYKILEKIANAEPLQDIFQSFLTAMETYLPDTACSIILCQEGHLCQPFAPSLPKAYVEKITAAVIPIAEGIGSCGTAAYRQEMVVSAHIATDPLWQNFKHLVIPYGIKSCWSMPVFGRDQTVLAVFGIYARETKSPQPSEITFVSKLTNLAGIAIERDQSTQALKQLNQELENRVVERTAALQASEERWQLALKGAKDGIWDWNLQTNQIFASKRLQTIYGSEEDDFPSSIDDWVKLIHPDDREKERLAIEEHLAGKSEFFEVEYRAKHQNGHYIWILSRAQAQRNALGQAVRMIGSETDITQRKIAEQELVLKQNHLEALLNHLPHLTWIKDEQGRFIAVNQPFAKVSGMTADAIVGKTDFDIWPAELAQAYRDDDDQILQTGQRKRVEEQVVRADGTWGWLETTKTPFKNEQGAFVGTVGIAADITERKHSEQQLQALSERFELAIKSAQIGIWERNYQSDRLSWDERMFEIYGVEPKAFEGTHQDWAKRVHPDDLKQALWENGDESPVYREFRVMRPDGSIRHIVSTALIEYNEQGQIMRAVGTNVDITDRKTAELALQASEEKFQRITESVPGVIFRYVLHPDGRDEFTYISPQIRQLYEFEPDAGLQDVQLMWDILHPDDVPHVSEAVQVSAESLQPFYVEMRLLFPKERIKWVRILSQPKRYGNSDIAWDGVIVDISDRKQAEEALAVLSERLQLALDSAEIGIWEWCGKTNKLIWDDRMFSLYGITPETFSGNYEDWLQRLHPEDVTQAKMQEEIALRKQTSVATEFRIIRSDGEVRFIYSNLSTLQTKQGNRVRTVGLDIDITERKQAEMALEKEILRRSAVFNASPDGIHILDRTGNLIEANASFAEMLGYSLDEVSQLNATDWDAQRSEAELQDIFQHYPANTRSTLETRHRRKDGSVFPVEITECSMEWNGEFALVCISRDISERKQAEAQLKLSNQELARATRLKDEFLANMSHELRTPLNAILGMTEGLQDTIFGQVNTEQLKALATIEQSGSHLLELINEILDLAKIEANNIDLTYSVVSVTHLCQSSLTFIKQQSLEKGIQLHLKMPWDLSPIRVNERRIRQVLINLLNNAVKFTPAGGKVTLKVEQLQTDEAHHAPVLRLEVTDTGIGIAPDGLTQLFQPFFQIDSALNRQYEGTGLGLALVKRIVESHGGRVTVTSTVGVGSCFAIELPYDSPTLEPLAPETPLASSDVSDEVTQATDAPLILLTADNEANSTMLSSYFETNGYRIEATANGESAIELALAERPHVILMDIHMPDMDGLTVIQHIRQHPALKQTPIIVLAALARAGDQERCLAAGADKFLNKPVKLQQLALSIQALLA